MMKHATVAASEDAVVRLFEKVRDNFHETASDSGDFGPFSASYSVGVRLEDGELKLQDGSILISELDVVYDPLILRLGVDLPRVCVGGFCIIPNPFGGCLVRAPRICVFEADPDITIPLDLSGLIKSELSGALSIQTRYAVDPARTPGMTNLDAEDAGVPDKWQFFLDPVWLDIDLIDIADTVGNLLDAAIDTVVGGLLGWLPGWARDLVRWILGPIVDLVRVLLDLADDIDEWLSNLLGTSLGLFDKIVELIADYFGSRYPIFEFENPYPVLGYDGALIPVKIPVRDLGVGITEREIVLSANVGL